MALVDLVVLDGSVGVSGEPNTRGCFALGQEQINRFAPSLSSKVPRGKGAVCVGAIRTLDSVQIQAQVQVIAVRQPSV